MSKAKQREKERKELEESKRLTGAGDVAKKTPIAEDPASILSKTSRTLDEQAALESRSFGIVNLDELEMRIGLQARTILEYFLRLTREEMRDLRVSIKDKADVALRAITTLEGSKQEIRWQDEMRKKPRRVSMTAYKKEREEKEKRLKSMLLRKKEVQIKQAEEALAEIERKRTAGAPEDVN